MKTPAELPPHIALPLVALTTDDPDAARVRMGELHEQGWSYGAIGRALDISPSAARGRVQAVAR